MTQECDGVWSKDRLQILEEIRLLGNNFYRCKQYRAAALLYRTGLGAIAPGHVQPNFLGFTIPRDVPEEVYRQYFTLLINFAQVLLNMPPKDMHRELAAMDASALCGVANFHPHWALQKWHDLTFADFLRQLQRPGCPPKLAYLGGLLAKARSRRSIALERCGNISGAVSDFPTAFGKLPVGVMEEELLEEIVLGFESPASGVKLPKEAMSIFSRPLECCHRATVDFIEIPNVDVTQCAAPLGKMDAAFSCGNYRAAAVFVISFLRADDSGGRGYIVGNWRGTREQMTLFTCCTFTPSPQTFLQSGAVMGSVLYCLSLSPDCCEMRGFHLLSSYDMFGAFQAPLELAPPSEVTLARRDTALVACCGALYVFGGCIQESRDGGDRLASQDLIVFKPDLSNHSVQCSLVQTGHKRPPARWGHATFVHGDFIYIFGGMYEGQEGCETWDIYLGEMCKFDVKSGDWTMVAIFGCTPCARAHMGVAFDERRAMIVGGVTAKPDGGEVYLADVWEFDFESCCWIQVVPEKPLEGWWISARSGAACSLVDSNTLVTFAGKCRYGPVGHEELSIIGVKRGMGAELAGKAGRSGPLRDNALIRACAGMAQIKSQLAAVPDWARDLYTAPAGPVNFYAMRSLDLVEGAFTPLLKSEIAYSPFLSSDCVFSSEGIQPIRPFGGDPGNVWGSMECPFDVAPRWLNVPLEVSVNLASASSAVQRAEDPVSLRQTVKHFGTVKAAVEYFKLCQPQVHLSGWRCVEVLHDGTLRTTDKQWQLQECEAFAIEDPPGCRQQIYVMAVLGRVFFCFLATRCPQQTSMPAGLFCMLLFKIQAFMLSNQQSTVATYCHHCGNGDPRVALGDTESCPQFSTKVCKGCHLVRYCDSKCQHADWEEPFGHKEVCKIYASHLPEHRR
ncbi:probable leucine-zipper-like transcriptional regulator 1 at N-terminal half [Coccomyxa sp. Obi]|nr:probable leucine-zipper-like transcriptional regulator 1 at N-terminal half [Coccomyxa sp. Obi]